MIARVVAAIERRFDRIALEQLRVVAARQAEEIEELQRKIAAEYGYDIEEHALVLYVRKKK